LAANYLAFVQLASTFSGSAGMSEGADSATSARRDQGIAPPPNWRALRSTHRAYPSHHL